MRCLESKQTVEHQRHRCSNRKATAATRRTEQTMVVPTPGNKCFSANDGEMIFGCFTYITQAVRSTGLGDYGSGETCAYASALLHTCIHVSTNTHRTQAHTSWTFAFSGSTPMSSGGSTSLDAPPCDAARSAIADATCTSSSKSEVTIEKTRHTYIHTYYMHTYIRNNQ